MVVKALLKDVSRSYENISIIVNEASVRSTTVNTQGGNSIMVNLEDSSLTESKLKGLESKLEGLVKEEVKEQVRKCMASKN